MGSNIKINQNETTIDKVIDKLSYCYIKLINEKKDLSLFPSVMLWGPPGIGKSQGVKQISKKIEKETKKKVNITDVRLLLLNPIDLRGIPVASKDKETAIWLKPKIFDMDKSDDVINILFLDEISAAPTSVQSAAYQITLDRKVGEHELPSNCIIIAAGNRLSDKAVAYKMPKPLSYRLMHFYLDSNFDSWEEWAVLNNIHPSIIGFLSVHNEFLNTFDATNDSHTFATPRSWEMVSNLLNNISDDMSNIKTLINGLIGKEIAYQFSNWVKTSYKLPDIKEIISGKQKDVPKDLSLLYGLISELIEYIKNNLEDTIGIVNVINYSTLFPKEFGFLFLEKLLTIELEGDKTMKQYLLSIPEFVDTLNKNLRYMGTSVNELFK